MSDSATTTVTLTPQMAGQFAEIAARERSTPDAVAAGAVADLSDTIRHVAADDPDAAERAAAGAFDAAKLLGSGVPGRSGRMAGTFATVVRNLPCRRAREVVPQADREDRIVVLHVIHAARSWLPHLGPAP